jgi:hypothetical protein
MDAGVRLETVYHRDQHVSVWDHSPEVSVLGGVPLAISIIRVPSVCYRRWWTQKRQANIGRDRKAERLA